jgi:lipopolysaccharide export system ATP-binding protein
MPQLVSPTTQTTTLEAIDISKTYKKRKVLSRTSLRVQTGQIVGLLGPNGAGKTTCFGILAGLIAADEGSVLLGGVNISTLPMYMRARFGMRYLPQDASVFRDMSVEDNLVAIFEIFEKNPAARDKKLEALLDDFNLTHIRSIKAKSLSGGERRRVEIARSLIGDPLFILLDEPFAGIDPKMIEDARNLLQNLKARGLGILITDHNARDTFSIVDHVYIMHHGSVLREGSPTLIANAPEVRQAYLGEQFSL